MKPNVKSLNLILSFACLCVLTLDGPLAQSKGGGGGGSTKSVTPLALYDANGTLVGRLAGAFGSYEVWIAGADGITRIGYPVHASFTSSNIVLAGSHVFYSLANCAGAEFVLSNTNGGGTNFPNVLRPGIAVKQDGVYPFSVSAPVTGQVIASRFDYLNGCVNESFITDDMRVPTWGAKFNFLGPFSAQ